MGTIEHSLRMQLSSDGPGYLGKFATEAAEQHSNQELTFPFIVALLSAGVLVSRTGTRIVNSQRRGGEQNASGNAEDGVQGPFRHLITLNGGRTTFLFMVARVLGCIVLVGLSAPAVVKDIYNKGWLIGGGATSEQLVLLANIYALTLASLALLGYGWRKWLISHNIAVLLTELAVYTYRDLWPLATVTQHPLDISEGWFLWGKIAILFFTTVVIPVVIPSVYIPLDPKTLAAELHPEQTASLLSLKTFGYLTPMIRASTKTAHLTPDQLPPTADYDKAQALATRAQPHLDPSKVRKGRHMGVGLFKFFVYDFITVIITLSIYTIAQLSTPYAVNRLLTSLEPGQTPAIRPWFWIGGMLLAPLVCSLSLHSYAHRTTRASAAMESLLTQFVFDLSLRVRFKAESSEKRPAGADSEGKGQKGEGTSGFSGKVNTLLTSDLSNLSAARDFLLVYYLLPLQLIGCSAFLYNILGWSAVAGMVTMIALLPVPGYINNHLQSVQDEKMKRTTNRTQTVTESMNVLRMIKLFGWEKKIQKRVNERREEELGWVWKRQLLITTTVAATALIPTISMLVTYATASLLFGLELKAAKIFSSMILFDTMRNELQRAGYILFTSIGGKVSINRFNAFFKEAELLDSQEPSDTSEPISEATENGIIGFRNASFTWTLDSEDGTLTPSNQFKLTIPGELEFAQGKINLIVGPTGSGKTSLLMALLGEMRFTPSQPDSMFNLPRFGGISLAVQESWVQNATIRANILFNSQYDEQRYRKVLYQCALEQDLELFDAGDQTEVGERGLTLSGGQKARLTLARAIYSKTQIILLDDVLAALDVHTSAWIVNKCFKGDLVQGRTLLLVTHNIPLAGPIADLIVSVNRDGVVTSRGQDTSAVLRLEPELQAEYSQDESAIANEENLVDNPSEKSKPSGKLILKEEIQEGNVSLKSLKFLAKMLGGRHTILFFSLWVFGFVAEESLRAFNVWFLGYWGSQYEKHPAEEVHVAWYLGIYVGLVVFTIFVFIARAIWFLIGRMGLARTVHRVLYASIISAPLRWHDETPTSRIITRMTQDIQSVDDQLMNTMEGFVSMGMMMLVALISAVLFVPVFILAGMVVAALGIHIGSQYLKAQLSVKRELINAKAPLLAHFGEAMAGLVSIRAYGAESMFKKESMIRIDHYVKLARMNSDLNRWIGVRIDSLGAVFTTSLAAYLTYASTLSSANIGFSLNRAVEFTFVILYVVRSFNLFQVEANSLERIVAYTEIEQEPAPTESGKPPAAWPTSGEIRVENLTARYSKTGPDVLHGLTFSLRAGERVGVVGRTGSGKSSLTLALLRCILTDGAVYFDGLQTSQINLDALRSNITIIPQMPELLSGTLRYNLDPFEEYDDATLNAALRSSGLYGSSHEESGENRLTLDSNIASSGANVSVGQRQIIALARAIIRSSKLLILDEATSAIDHETDAVIQNTLRRELGPDVTVLTVAHRLQTIADADRIMVLDAGRLVEFSSPAELLAKSNGFFKALVDESGDKEHLYEVARQKGLASSSSS